MRIFNPPPDGTQDTSEDPQALTEEFGTSAIEYLRALEKSIVTYTGDKVLLK